MERIVETALLPLLHILCGSDEIDQSISMRFDDLQIHRKYPPLLHVDSQQTGEGDGCIASAISRRSESQEKDYINSINMYLSIG